MVAFASLSVGTVNFSFFQIIETILLSMGGHSEPSQIQSIIMDIRLPRIILALLVGSVLAILGAVMQGLFRNPLADPSLIGVSGGASVGASIVIVTARSLIRRLYVCQGRIPTCWMPSSGRGICFI